MASFILRKPIDRIGYGGYLKLACQFPEFIDYVESVCKEFRELYANIDGAKPYCVKRVAVLVLELPAGRPVLVVVVALVNDELGAERVASLFFELPAAPSPSP